MGSKIQKIAPDYQRIYSDILSRKFPHKKEICKKLLNKKYLSAIDIITLNEKIFGSANQDNHKHNSYRKCDILQILDYQKKNMLNNTQLANHFKISRNTISKWKKMFL